MCGCRGQVVEEFAVCSHPGGQDSGQAGAAGGVGIHIGGDVEALGAYLIYALDDPVYFGVVALGDGLEVVDFDRDVGALSDFDGFVQGLEKFVGLGPYVGDIDTARSCCCLADFDDFVCAGICVRRVDEGVGRAEGAVFHGFGHDAVHIFHFSGRRLAHSHAHRKRAQGARAQEGPDVGRDASFDHGVEPVAEAMPVPRAFPPVFR